MEHAEKNKVLTKDVIEIAMDFISMYKKALGGGWQIRRGRDFVSQDVKEKKDERTDWGNLLQSPMLEKQ